MGHCPRGTAWQRLAHPTHRNPGLRQHALNGWPHRRYNGLRPTHPNRGSTMQPETHSPVTRAQWLALTAALLGWMFDGAEMGVFSLVGRAAVLELLGTQDEGTVGLWFGVIIAGFLVGAATGGVLFGWL